LKGKNRFLNLTSDNIEELQSGIPLADLPKAFQDAIVFTRRTPAQFIWIDSMCIIQDSDEDWEVEALRMEDVYSNAYCNIAATSGSGGCFLERDVEACMPMIFRIASADNILSRNFLSKLGGSRSSKTDNLIDSGTYVCEERGLWEREITQSALGRRAWVFQERLLARRVLHFASSQIFFECCSFQAAEVSPKGMAAPNYLGTRLKTEFAHALTSLEDYPVSPEQRALSKQRDLI
jgi:hypothetical protein